MDNDTAAQEQREQNQRDAARGLRAQAILRGDLGPVLRRWVSASVLPTADRLRTFCESVQAGDLKRAGLSINSAVFGLPEVHRGRDLGPILKWSLKGSSPGRASAGTTYAEDLVLSVLGTAITLCAGGGTQGHHEGEGGKVFPLVSVLDKCAEAARECAMGQFLTQVQGAKTMLKVRDSTRPGWSQKGKMDAIAALLAGQVRSGIDDEAEAGSREVVEIVTTQGDKKLRRIELRNPTQDDWELLDVARKVKGEANVYKPTWITFAMIVLCAAQAESGLFDLVAMKSNGRGKPHGLALSDQAFEAIKGDLSKWMSAGFVNEPMTTPPRNGGYLTVHHRPVSGANGPGGHRTTAQGTEAWEVASRVLAGTAWTVALATYAWLRTGGEATLKASLKGDERREVSIMGAYARASGAPFYLPIFMDFRGRLYPRTHLVSYQGGDLQKGLLCFPADAIGNDLDADAEECLIRHCAGLAGLDKAPMPEREAWWYAQSSQPIETVLQGSKKPVQLYTALSLVRTRQADRVPVQIDGTCNGLQHLTALFRDETAAPHVNLSASSLEDAPGDIYGAVATLVRERLALRDTPWARRLRATLKIDRTVTKGPVMVLPYGGTLEAIVGAAKGAVLEQAPSALMPNGMRVNPWQECLVPTDGGEWVRDEEAIAGNYLAFRDRPLDSHPLLSMDVRNLGGLIWRAIVDTLPRPMAAMKTFRGIAQYVGGRSIEWRTAPLSTPLGGTIAGAPLGLPLWIVQAKAKADTKTLNMKGLHLPASVRGLGLRIGRDEVDPRSHSSGIVANFIHSHDADHLRRTMRLFEQALGRSYEGSARAPAAMEHPYGETHRSGSDGIRIPPSSPNYSGPQRSSRQGTPDTWEPTRSTDRNSSTLSFGANHDCFITRPSTMPQLMVASRAAFRQKYGEASPSSGSVQSSSQHPLRQPVRLRSLGPDSAIEEHIDWYALADAAGAPPFPPLGSWDPDTVMQSAWFFS